MKLSFREFLKSKIEKNEPVIFDGGMGTMIQATGVTEYDIPEDLSITHPQIIKDIHKKYLDAGANVLTGNTFGINPLKLETTKYTLEEYLKAEFDILKESVSEAEKEGNTEPHYISWDSGQIGKLLEPMGELTFDEAYEAYKLTAVTAEKYGAELAIIETMSDLHEMKAAILAIKENTNLPIVATTTFQDNLRTLTGADVLTCVTYLEALRVDVIGFNCGGSLKDGEELSRQFCKYAHIPVLVQPNAGIPVVQNGKAVFLVKPEEFAQSQLKNRKEGVALLGGCCGTTPDHIKAMKEAIRNEELGIRNDVTSSVVEKSSNETDSSTSVGMTEMKNIKRCHFERSREIFNSTFICSYNASVQIGGSAGPQIVGERINPTGKKKVKAALQAHDMNFVLEEAESQINAGAQILDVNVGLPGIDEAQTMVDAVKTIQSAFNTPLQLDSSEAPVLEKGLRYYNGKALINSVNGRQDVMDKVFPLVKHYGGSVVALCIDENGIAPTAEGRCEVARKIIREAAKYDIPVRDIVIDTLTLTVSSQQKEALETCRAISILKEEFGEQGLQFILGVSNISFGLPRRDIVNSRFFSMALYSGLTACIINPLSEPMMETYYGYRALAGFDENCLEYIEKYNDTTAPVYGISKDAVKNVVVEPVETTKNNGHFDKLNDRNSVTLPENLSDEEKSLIDTICKGFKDSSPEITKKLLDSGKQPVEIIDRCIVPALDLVGKDFEVGKKFLPQLLLSADTVSASFGVIKAFMENSGVKQEEKGKIVIATVFGDIHDIGKNIVKAMLENYGYTVIDLGKNVPYETVVNTVLENDIKLVGLSALMTTTVGNMETTIKLLREATEKVGKTVKIIAGGAVLTEDYAAKIGADYFGKDAMATVNVAKEVFGK